MADNEGEEASSRGNEWEVVSLTASTYSASPGPKRVDDDNKVTEFIEYDENTARVMFMSNHFVFPSSEHENLPLKPDKNEIHNEPTSEGVASNELPRFDMNDSGKKNVENWNAKELPVPVESPGIQIFDEKGNNRLSVRGTEFEAGMGLRGLNLIDSENDVSGLTMYDEHTVVVESCDPSQKSLDYSSDISKEVKCNKSRLPSEAWWKRRVASVYRNAKETNAYSPIFVAAAVVGLVILGQRSTK